MYDFAFTSFSVNFFKQNLVLASKDRPSTGLLKLMSVICVTYLHVV